MLFEQNPIELSEALAEKYNYRKLPKSVSNSAQNAYLSTLPSWCCLHGNPDERLYTHSGTLVAYGYKRIVIGDYGAFIEMTREQMVRESICAKKGEEYRYKDPKFRTSVKYFWYTSKDQSDIKIYHQQQQVNYADYKVGRFYISPLHVSPTYDNCQF